jgi:hypothetical protein
MAKLVLVKGIIPRRLTAGQVIKNPDSHPPEFLLACPKCGANGLVQDHDEFTIEVHEPVSEHAPVRNISLLPHLDCPYCKTRFKAVDGVVEYVSGDAP